MVLNFGQSLFGRSSIFKISPEDNDVLQFEGSRRTTGKKNNQITETLSPGTMADDDSIGTVAWTNPDNAKVSDDTKTTSTNDAPGGQAIQNSIRIVKGGTISGDEKSTDAGMAFPEQYISYGGITNLWGLTWKAADINASNFGFVYSAEARDTGVISHYLKATNFGFAIPTESVIDGILVEVEELALNLRQATIDHIRITIYYRT